MVFSSFVFVVLFLPIVLIGYYCMSRFKSNIYQKLFLILASLFFYGYYDVKLLPLIIVSIAVNYIIAVMIQRNSGKKSISKLYLVIGILFNVLLIGYFKYYDFFLESVNSIFGFNFALKNIALPLGISFFTFQQLSFLVSVYTGEEEVKGIVDYVLFVSFFPQLVAGPIVLYKEMIFQFRENWRRKFNTENFSCGLYMFSIGIFKKAVIADTVALFVNNGFDMNELGFVSAWVTVLSYTLQIYFDFSGYSDMAVGLGKMFNIELPFNFDAPYKSASITEFWRRWHITLGRALSTYIYKPLGGNRKGLPVTCVNLFATFLVSGLWHGAAWTFVLWGVLHGCCVVFERIFKNYLEKIPKAIRIGCTFIVVNFLWVLFRAETFEQAKRVYAGMINFKSFDLAKIAEIAFDGLINFPNAIDYLYVIGLIAVLLVIVFACRSSAERFKSFAPTKGNAVSAALMLSVSLLALSRESVFIYFNF